jgi:O-antigen/teichoic acid export membrane protein
VRVKRADSTTIVRNTVLNSIGGVVTAVLAIALTPFLLRRLGTGEYGVWLLATTFTLSQGLGLTDLGLRQTGVRFIAQVAAADDVGRLNRVVSSLLAMSASIGIVVSAGIVVATSWLIDVFGVTADLQQAATAAFILVGVQSLVDLCSGAFLAVLEGFQQYLLLRIADVGGRALWGGATVVVVLLGHGVRAIAAVSLVVAVLTLGYSIWAAHLIRPDMRVSRHRVDARTSRELLGYGAWFSVIRVAGVIYGQMDRIIVGSAIGIAAVARYDVPYKIHAISALVLALAPSAVMPASALLQAQGDDDRIRSLYLRGSRYAVAMCTPFAIAAMIHARPLIRTWIGSAEFASLADEARVFLLYPLFVSFHVIGVTMLVGMGRIRVLATLAMMSAAINLIVSIALVAPLGLMGVIVGTQVAYASVWIPYLVLSLRLVGVSVTEWRREVLLPNLVAPAIQVVVGIASSRLVDGFDQFWMVALAVLVNAGIGVGAFAFIVMGAGERRALVASVVPGGTSP